MNSSSSDKPVFRSRCTVTRSDIANYGSFLSTSLSLSEASRIGWYRSMARRYTPRPPTHLPRVNRVLFADDALDHLPTPGDCVDTTCWTGKFGGTRSFSILGEAFYQDRLLCMFESLRVLVATTEEQSQYIKQLHIERKTQIAFQPVDMDAYVEDVSTAINSMDLYTGHSEVDALSHLNMAFYPKFVANAIPPGMILGKPKRLDVDYIAEIPLAATVNVTMRRGKEQNVVFFLTRNTKGKLVNRVRFEFDPTRTLPTKPKIPRHVASPLVVLVRYEHSCSSGCFAQWTLDNMDLALTTLTSKRNDQITSIHSLDDLVARFPTSEIKVEFQYVPIMGEIFVGKTSIGQSNNSAIEVEFRDAYSPGIVMKGTMTRTYDYNVKIGDISNNWRKLGSYAPQFRSQYIDFEGKFRLIHLMAMVDDTHHTLTKKDSARPMSDFMARLENLQPDSWMESYTIQFVNMKQLNEWSNTNGQLRIDLSRSDVEQGYRFDFILKTNKGDDVLACCVSTKDIRDSNSMLKSSKSFAFKDESFRQMQHEIEGVIEPRYAKL